jgi:hypothetical protein
VPQLLSGCEASAETIASVLSKFLVKSGTPIFGLLQFWYEAQGVQHKINAAASSRSDNLYALVSQRNPVINAGMPA